jgi:hypothetical protein
MNMEVAQAAMLRKIVLTDQQREQLGTAGRK